MDIAALEYYEALSAVAIGILTICGIIFGWFRNIFNYVVKLFKSNEKDPLTIDIPRQTLSLQPTGRNPLWWHMGKQGDQPAMQIVGDLTATNISKYNVLITLATMKRPKARGLVHVSGGEDEPFSSSNLIESRQMSDMRFHFWVMPPVKAKGQVFKADISIVDQFGNTHWLRNLEFEYQ